MNVSPQRQAKKNPATATARTVAHGSRSGAEAKALFRHVISFVRRREFAVRFWDGETLLPDAGTPPRFTLVLAEPEAVRHMFERPGSLRFGEAYAHGLFDVEGPLAEALAQAGALIDLPLSWSQKLAIAWRCLRLPKFQPPGRGVFGGVALHGASGSRERRKRAINYHYDQPLEFWQLWLEVGRIIFSASASRMAETKSFSSCTTQSFRYRSCCGILLYPPPKIRSTGQMIFS